MMNGRTNIYSFSEVEKLLIRLVKAGIKEDVRETQKELYSAIWGRRGD